MKKFLKILIVHSLNDLFKHKSFFLLTFIIILMDRGLKVLKDAYNFEMGGASLQRIDTHTAVYLFDQLPYKLMVLLKDYRIFLILTGLFLLKQIISLWPSSDMRRMHRHEKPSVGNSWYGMP
ncbi:MAG: hypothetical protein PVI90_01215 [Desulfobacteraceae bacterium]|jgi:hypothetical protein